jgi:hypothetical protein
VASQPGPILGVSWVGGGGVSHDVTLIFHVKLSCQATARCKARLHLRPWQSEFSCLEIFRRGEGDVTTRPHLGLP